jgi:SAM-dependent methyltransferase
MGEISPEFVHAVMLAEDDRFYQHHGFDLEQILIAVKRNWLKRRYVYGGSTITQQLARNLYLRPRKTLIRKAKDDAVVARSGAHYYISDVALPGGINIPERTAFDRAVFLFSIQDIDNVHDAVKNAAKLLKPGGELALFMVHPAFRIPRQSGWGKDTARQLTYRRIDRYKTAATIPLPQRTGTREGDHVTSFFYHRPLATYVEALRNAGFMIADLQELYSGTRGPEVEFPHFLLIRAVKHN